MRSILKLTFTVMALILICFQSGFTQEIDGGSFPQTCDASIYAAYQDDLPLWGESYNPCGNAFTWTFEGYVIHSGFENNAIIYPQVVNSDLNRSFDSAWMPTGAFSVTDANFTGTGQQDFLRIAIWSGSDPDKFSNLTFSVHYYNKPAQ